VCRHGEVLTKNNDVWPYGPGFLEWVQFKSLNEDQLEGHASVYFAVDVYRDSKRAVLAASSSAAASGWPSAAANIDI
jgi:hypothetical protein